MKNEDTDTCGTTATARDDNSVEVGDLVVWIIGYVGGPGARFQEAQRRQRQQGSHRNGHIFFQLETHTMINQKACVYSANRCLIRHEVNHTQPTHAGSSVLARLVAYRDSACSELG